MVCLATRQSEGGGRGKYRPLHGDVPVSSATKRQHAMGTHDIHPITKHDAQPKSDSNSEHTKNKARSPRPHRKTNDRIHELIHELSELKDKHRYFVTINDTSRTQVEGLWRTQQEHTRTSKGNTKARYGTTVFIHKRGSKHLKEMQHSGQRLKGVTLKRMFRLQTVSAYFTHVGCGDEHVPQIYSEFQKNSDRCRKTNTHTHLFVRGEVKANVGKKSTICHERRAKHGKQLDNVHMNRALVKHCKDAEIPNQIDTNSDHKAVISNIEMPIGHKKETETQHISCEDSRAIGSNHTIDVYHTFTPTARPEHEQPLARNHDQ